MLLFLVYSIMYYKNAIGEKRSVRFENLAENGKETPAIAERIDIDEFESQKIAYTEAEVRKLKESKEYLKMMK